jgi:manganese oxidase
MKYIRSSLIFGSLLFFFACNGQNNPAPVQDHLNQTPVTREYWLTVEPEAWTIAPNRDEVSGVLIPKADSTFNSLRFSAYSPGFKSRLPENALLGIAGPVIEANVGDHLIVHLKNLDNQYKRTHSLHVHGLEYKPEMDGGYMASNPDAPGTAIKYGESFTYEYDATESSVGVWPYHDHSIEGSENTQLGMYGAIRVHGPSEKKFDREFFVFFSGVDEPLTGLKRDFDVINGRAYVGNTPMLMAKLGEMVRFNVLAIGKEFHTFHVHGFRWEDNGQNEDVKMVGPAMSWSVQFVADKPGMWMYHCHVEDHMTNGMMGMFMVGSSLN